MQISALRDIQQLHARPDAEHRHPALGDQPHQQPIELFAPCVHRAHAGVEHETIAPRVEVGSADQHHAIQKFKHAIQIVGLAHRRKHNGNSSH